jgi:hypothetical protein
MTSLSLSDEVHPATRGGLYADRQDGRDQAAASSTANIMGYADPEGGISVGLLRPGDLSVGLSASSSSSASLMRP